jgi:hypothetical protein
MTTEERYRLSNVQVRAARARFLNDVAAAKARLAPDRLKAEARAAAVKAVTDVRREVRSTAAAHPLAIGAIVTTIVVVIFRKPLLALSRTLYVSFRNRRRSEAEPDHVQPVDAEVEAEPVVSEEPGHEQ